MKNKKILICIFSYNVEDYIDKVFKNLKKYKHLNKSILFINDCSTDKTKEKINNIKKKNNKTKIVIINNKTNKGYGGNYKIAIKFALKNNFQKLIFLHGDNQYPASKISKLIKYLDTSDLTFGSRISNKNSSYKNMPRLKLYVNKVLTFFINLLFNVNFSEYFSGFRGFKLDKLKKIKIQKLSNSYPIEQQIHYIFIKKKFKIKEFPIPTVYEDQISRIPPIKYVLTVMFNAIYLALLK
tara:strand:+ start:809 stop:1525 length:717 start_codon:yes stop_codon:yes gene_type:complete